MSRADAVDVQIEGWQASGYGLHPLGVGVLERCARISETLDASLRLAVRPHGIGPTEYRLLLALGSASDRRGLRPRDLGRALRMSSATVTNLSARLERHQLVSRTRPSRGDRRAVYVRITPHGEALVEAVAPVHTAEAKRALQSLTKTECRALESALRKVSLALGDQAPAPEERPS